jgi:hypothetical protein
LTGALTRGNYPRKHSPRRRSYQVPDLQHSGIDQQKGNHKSVDRRPIYSKLAKNEEIQRWTRPTRHQHFWPQDPRATRRFTRPPSIATCHVNPTRISDPVLFADLKKKNQNLKFQNSKKKKKKIQKTGSN